MTRADLDKKPAEVAAMFDALAGRYDLMNDILSMGQVRLWRQRVRRILAPLPGERVLDLAAGTGTSSEVFAEAGADCVACDFSLGMLTSGKARLAAGGATSPGGPRGGASLRAQLRAAGRAARGPSAFVGPGRRSPALGGRLQEVGGPKGGEASLGGRVAFAAGDAVRLPFRDDSFDAVTISFGLRNVHGTQAALEEMWRVTRPGGRLVVCEFSRITVPPVDMLYRRYLTAVLPAIARRVARNPAAYDYLAESITDWPAQRELADVIRAAGWSSVKWRNVTLGVVAIHVGRKLRVPA